MSVGKTVRLRRQAGGLDRQQLAAAAQLSESSIAKLERDVHDPALGTFLRICRALGANPIDVLIDADLASPTERVDPLEQSVLSLFHQLPGPARKEARDLFELIVLGELERHRREG